MSLIYITEVYENPVDDHPVPEYGPCFTTEEMAKLWVETYYPGRAHHRVRQDVGPERTQLLRLQWRQSDIGTHGHYLELVIPGETVRYAVGFVRPASLQEEL